MQGWAPSHLPEGVPPGLEELLSCPPGEGSTMGLPLHSIPSTAGARFNQMVAMNTVPTICSSQTLCLVTHFIFTAAL